MLHIPFSSTSVSHSFNPSQPQTSSSMDFSKKRKTEENGDTSPSPNLTSDDARKIIESFTHDQLLNILQDAAVRHVDVLDAVRSIADPDTTQRKLFVRGLGFDTTTDRLRSVFSSYGDIEEAIVIVDRGTGKSKGFGFVTFKHIDGALLALKEPSKKIDGRIAVAQLAALGGSGPAANKSTAGVTSDVSNRKIYVGSVPAEMSSERLLGHFSGYGEIEEGPLGFDKHTGKSRGFCFMIFKTEEGARASLVDPIKNIDGHQLACKLAVDNKKGKPGATATANPGVQNQSGVPSNGAGDRTGMPPPSSMPMSQYGGLSSFGGYSGVPPLAHHQTNLTSPLPSSMSGAYSGNSQFGGPVPGEYSGLHNAGSLYRLPPNSAGMPSAGMPSAGFPESGHYGFPTQQHHQPSQMPRIPQGGMYPGMPPYF